MKECALDYTFLTLGIDSDRIEQPIVMTERLTNPLFTRACEFVIGSGDNLADISDF